VELAARLPAARVVGLEIDPARAATAEALADPPRLRFEVGGFELAGLRPDVVRAMNVLRQYDEDEVAPAWRQMGAALAPGGFVVDGTCDELGRTAAWLSVDVDGIPRTLTLSARLASLDRPATLAERLPKALIHRNVPGEAVHALLADLDDAWHRAAPYGAFGARQRWMAAVVALGNRGWPVVGGRSRWRLGELTVTVGSCCPTGSWPW
jgi:SAM-dependent methyltransferase